MMCNQAVKNGSPDASIKETRERLTRHGGTQAYMCVVAAIYSPVWGKPTVE